MVEISWLIEAQRDLKEIFDYIALDSSKYASLQIDRIYQKVALLKTQPLLGKVVPELENNSIRELVEGNYRIIYRVVNEKRLHILMVHHGARDLRRRF
jgi:addiction module RelE/StbE family toxin